MDLKEKIINLLENSDKPLLPSEIIPLFTDEEAPLFNNLMLELQEDGVVLFTKKGKIALPEMLEMYIGRYISQNSGGALIYNDEKYSLLRKDCLSLIPGDLILFEMFDKKAHKAKFVKIISRKTKSVVGTFNPNKFGGYIECDGRNMPNIFVDRGYTGGAKKGDKVFASIYKYDKKGMHLAKIENVFGKASSLRSNYNSILLEYDIDPFYPPKPETLAEKLFIKGISKASLKNRLDLTNENIFTIDSKESKDLDDAVLVKKLEDGYELSVHIADVSHYVTEDSELDKEAYNRGTSVYFADKVVPMLPKSLSNGICSLNEGEIRLTLSAFIKFDNKGKMIDYHFAKSFIKSKIKGIYKEIDEILLGTADDNIKKKYSDVLNEISIMAELSNILDGAKKKRNSLDFEVPEAKIIVEDDKIVDIVKRERGLSDVIIENFMVSANCAVATYFDAMDVPAIYRTHAEPSAQKIEKFQNVLKLYGKSVKIYDGKLYQAEIIKMLASIKDEPYEKILSQMTLRAMSKAIYERACTGHYGLALTHYLHFTSPIRRYPDLIVHRMLKKVLNEEKINKKKYIPIVDDCAKRSTDREENAVNAERDIEKLYKAQYMENHIGEEFDGIISSVTSFGFFVELENTIEGLCHMRTLKDDYYDFNEMTMSIKGERTGKVYHLGDKVKVRLIKASIIDREIDFEVC